MSMKMPTFPTTRDCGRQMLKNYDSQVTKPIYAATLKAWYAHLGRKADLWVNKLTPADYSTFKKWGLPKLAPSTRKRNLQAVRGLVKWAIEHRHLLVDILKPGAKPAKVGRSQPASRKQPVGTPPSAAATTATGKISAAKSPALPKTGQSRTGKPDLTSMPTAPVEYASCAHCRSAGRCKLSVPALISPPANGMKSPITKKGHTHFYNLMRADVPGGQKVACTEPPKEMIGQSYCYYRRTGITEHMIATGVAPGPDDVPPPRPAIAKSA